MNGLSGTVRRPPCLLPEIPIVDHAYDLQVMGDQIFIADGEWGLAVLETGPLALNISHSGQALERSWNSSDPNYEGTDVGSRVAVP